MFVVFSSFPRRVLRSVACYCGIHHLFNFQFTKDSITLLHFPLVFNVNQLAPTSLSFILLNIHRCLFRLRKKHSIPPIDGCHFKLIVSIVMMKTEFNVRHMELLFPRFPFKIPDSFFKALIQTQLND